MIEERTAAANGAHILVKTLLANGVETCFANPGTSEMHFVAALDQVPGMRCVLGLQENVVTGMADGYYRIARKSACTLLHCGPGLANGWANLHNARRARSGIVNIVGDQATYHRPLDAPLTADTDALARAVSAWTRTSQDARHVGADASVAVQAANAAPGHIATLILPSDVSWNEGGEVGPVVSSVPAPKASAKAVEAAARAVQSEGATMLLLAGEALSEHAQAWLGRLTNRFDVSLMAEYAIARIARGAGRLAIERMPYANEKASAALSRYRRVVLVNAVEPVGFFAYPGKPSRLLPEGVELVTLSKPHEDPVDALQALCDRLGIRADAPLRQEPRARPIVGTGRPTPEGLAATIGALLPEHAIVSDESISYGRGFYQSTYAAAPHDWLHLAGGAIGDGLPVATGAAIAADSQRRVLSLQADGSAMYSLQALWTQARERLPCTTVLLNNRKYQILLGEYAGVGAVAGQTALDMLDLSNPDIGFTHLARGLGVEAARATTLEECADLLKASFSRRDPFLIELMVD